MEHDMKVQPLSVCAIALRPPELFRQRFRDQLPQRNSLFGGNRFCPFEKSVPEFPE